MKITVEYVGYGGYFFKDEDGRQIKNIQKLLVENKDGIKGKLKCTGSSRVVEHGYSGTEEQWSFIDLEINFHSLKNGDEFTTNDIIEYYDIVKEKVPMLKVNGMTGKFTYDLKATKVATFISRLDKIGINVTLFGNYPWVYFDSICGIKVREKFYSDHGFTIFLGETIPDIGEVFSLIRKYTK